MKADLLFDCKQELAEGVIWDAQQRRLIWVNIHEGEIWQSKDGAAPTCVKFDEKVGSFCIRKTGGFALATASGFALVDAGFQSFKSVALVERDLSSTRLNDGRCDRQGRFVAGGICDAEGRPAISAVYRLDPDLSVEKIIGNVSIGNSICFSLDGATMYFTDMPSGNIMMFDYDVSTGKVSNGRVFTDGDGEPGLPDGSVIDSEGFLWNARWGGSRVSRFNKEGRVDRYVDVPVSQVSCVGFGGDTYNDMFITTAWYQMTPEQRAAEPLSGGIFRTKVDVPGVPEVRFGG